MKEIVQKIIETERQVRDKIDNARGEAQKIVSNAEKRSRELIDERRQSAAQEAHDLIEKMKSDAEEEKRRQIENVKGGSPELIRTKSREIDLAVERITGIVSGVERD